tara:strand:- start:2376 stop:3647 length:1272 start_codon:yes stop_codon:yes gene_type:complete
MINTKTILFAGLFALALPQMAGAQALKNVRAPANLPPADYTGAQFVDNKGCIFIRAGRLGPVTWVPRIDQARKHMCSKSYTPTFATQVATTDDAKPATPPVKGTTLNRGNVAYEGDVIKPVGAPDTSLVQAKEAKKVTQVSDAAKAIKAAAAETARNERSAKLAKQEQVAAQMKADALATKKANETRKAAQLAQAMKDAEAASIAKDLQKAAAAQKAADAKAARIAQRTAAKAARATAMAQKKAATAAARVAAKVARDVKRQAILDARAADQVAKAASKEAKKAKAMKMAAAKTKAADEAKAAAAKTKAAAAKTKAAAKPVKVAAKPVAKPAVVAKTTQAKAPVKVATVFKSGYYVDLGTTFSAANAHAMENRLLASGYRVQTQASGSKTKVFAGPFRTESNARVAFYQVATQGYKSAKVVKK